MNTLETRIADYKSSVMNEFLGRKIEISGFTNGTESTSLQGGERVIII
jgi:hypothetical protein